MSIYCLTSSFVLLWRKTIMQVWNNMRVCLFLGIPLSVKDDFWTWLDKIKCSLALTWKTHPVKLSSAHSETHKCTTVTQQMQRSCSFPHCNLHYWFSFHPADRTKQRDLSERERKGRKKERARETEKYDAIMETDVLCIWTTGNSM